MPSSLSSLRTARTALAAALLLVGCSESSLLPEPASDIPAVIDAPTAIEPPEGGDELDVSCDLSFPPPSECLAAEAETWYADCGAGAPFAMSDLLSAIAEGMARQRIPYGRPTPDEWRDCSGNFLRLSSYLASACPAGAPDLAAPAGIAHYTPEGPNTTGLEARARSSRDLARWYLEQGRFVPVWYDDPADLARLRYLVKPGAVLWFAERGPREADGIEQLFERNGKRTHIQHMGTVIHVTYDEDGDIVDYAMFHGRNGRKPASITDDHRYPGDGRRPALGNGDQYLVGIGTLLPLAPPP